VTVPELVKPLVGAASYKKSYMNVFKHGTCMAQHSGCWPAALKATTHNLHSVEVVVILEAVTDLSKLHGAGQPREDGIQAVNQLLSSLCLA
jgi:hypothetical protein